MDKRMQLQLNANRKIVGVLRGFDAFMNIILEESVEEISPNEHNTIGTCVIRGNSIVVMEPLERIP